MNETFSPSVFDPEALRDIRLSVRKCYIKRALQQTACLMKEGSSSFSFDDLLQRYLKRSDDPIEAAKNQLYWRNQAISWAFLPIVAAGGLYFLSHLLSGFPEANPSFEFGSKLPENLARYLREHELLNRREIIESTANKMIEELQDAKPKKQQTQNEKKEALTKRASVADIMQEVSQLPIRLILSMALNPYTFIAALGLGSLSGLLFNPIVNTLNKSRVENWMQAEQREYVRDLTKAIQTTELMTHKLYGKAWKQLSRDEKERVKEQLELLGYDSDHINDLIDRLERGYHEVKTSSAKSGAVKAAGQDFATLSLGGVNLSLSSILPAIWAIAILSFTFPVLSDIYRNYFMRPFYLSYQPKLEHKYQTILQQIAEYEGMRQMYKPTKLNVYLHGLEAALNKEIQKDLEKLLRDQKAALSEGINTDTEQEKDKKE